MNKLSSFLVVVAVILVGCFSNGNEAHAAGPGIIYYNNPYCGLWGNGSCPETWMRNRSNTRTLAIYTPYGRNNCDRGSMSVWRMGHPNNSWGAGFTNEDWQDLEVAKQKTGGYYRWGCCFSGEPYNAICLN